MNILVFLFGMLITAFVVFNVWAGKCIFVTDVERQFKKNGKKGTAKVKYFAQGRSVSDNSPTSGSRCAMVELFDEKGNSLGGDYSISGRPEIGSIIDVMYIESKILKYQVRPIGYKSDDGKVLDVLMIIFAVLGLSISAIVSINI